MKRRFTILTAAFALLAFLAIPMGMTGQTRTEEVYSTCLFGSDYNSQSVGSYTATWTATNGDYTWTIVNGNNNNNAWSYVKFGRKNNASVGKITTTEAYEQAITKVDLTIDAITAGSVNSIKLYASTGNDTWTEVGSFAKSTGLQTVTVASPAANQYYMIEFDCASGSANGLVTVSKVEYYYNTSGANSPTISADNVELAYDATSGAIEYTVNNPVQGGELTASTNAEWITIGTVGETVPFTCTVNEGSIRTATVTLTYSYGNDNVTKDITITQAANPNGPGSQANPYTVAQARAAIDAGTGTQGVYATGIVSAIPTAYNSTYGNVTFNMVDEEGDEVFLQAYRCGGDEAANVAVGDVAVVYGNLIKYGSTYEFGEGCQLVSLTHPVITTPVVTVTPNTINAPAEGVDGTLALTYENINEFISFDYYFCDANGGELEGNDPDWIYAEINEENDAYTLSYIIDANDGAARTAYMKVYTFDDNEEEVYAIVTVNQEEYVAPTYAELPFAFNGGKADIEGTDGLYEGDLGTDYNATNNPNTKLKFDGTGDWLLLQFNERPGTLTFDIKNNSFSGGTFKVQTSEDGVTYTDLETYTEITGTQNEEFTDLGENVRYIKWIYTNKASGNVGLGNIALAEYVAPVLVASITVNPDVVELDAEEHDGTLDLTYENLTITEMSDFDIQFCDANGDELSEEPDWIEVLVAEQDPEIGEGYVVSYYMVENEGTDARTAYFKVYAMDDETNLVYSNLVTITQAAPVAPPTPGTWVLTDLADLTADDIFVIVGDNGETYAMSNDNGASNPPAAVEVIVAEGTLSAEPAANLQWNISITDDGYTFYPNGETETWLYCTNTNNGVRVGTNDNKVFTIEDGYLKNVATSRYVGIYNSQDWRCYTNTTGNIANQTFAFYKKVAQPATETHTLTINGYQNDENDGGYYLIASPVNVDPATVGMTTGDFDLYYFDEGQELEWRNYEATSFNLVPGKGYLYAKKATTEGETFSFELTGTPYSGNGTIDLTYTENAEFAGFNLIGNPFGTNANLDLPYYRLNSDGSALNTTTESSEINVMEGVFVQATAANPKANFTKVGESAKKIGQLNVKVTRNRSVILDNAIIRFDEGATLSKFQLNANSTKLYFTEGNQDFAVVRSANEGEMPVNFKAGENGTYTISIDAENVDVNYLHLIDNMTGADVDLLATPSYSFEAKVTDYASRFRLVFSANSGVNEQNSETFAFFNGNNLVINNEGEATLQVIDMMGRMISSEQINGSYNNSLNLSAGVYVLRLSNGNTVKTQKIVID